jgi:trehalose 6-phosphate phosphatase
MALGFGVALGRRVTDFVPAGYHKGRALREVRLRIRPDVVFYFGDTASDEPAFAMLPPGDFSVRVGPGSTTARYRVRGPREVTRFLRALVRLRADARRT